jgi:hypothetical protein
MTGEGDLSLSHRPPPDSASAAPRPAPVAGDIVFLTSDGVADNFDPFILKTAAQACNASQWMSMEESAEDNTTQLLPVIDATESQAQQMQNMTRKVQELRTCQMAAAGVGGSLTAQALVQGLVDHVMAVSVHRAVQGSVAGCAFPEGAQPIWHGLCTYMM